MIKELYFIQYFYSIISQLLLL